MFGYVIYLFLNRHVFYLFFDAGLIRENLSSWKFFININITPKNEHIKEK